MKKNLFLRLCLMTVVVLTLNSCRQDLLPEQETYSNSGAFQLTSKRISLNEAKHKAKLLPEIEKAENEIKAYSNSKVQGKTIDFGNGMIINTDNVIYMENGPDYHTYTFSIQRSSPLPDAPVENLVFTPLPDGSYKAYLVTYNFSEAEKNAIRNGGDVAINNKATVTPLEGTFASVMSVDQCTMQISDYYTWCGEGKHNDGNPCNAPGGVYSQHIVTMTMVCQGGLSPQPGIEGPVDGGSGEPGGATSPNPCSVNGVYVNPQDPANSSCNGGVVTAPNLPNLGDDPCVKTKRSITAANTVLKNSNVQTKMDVVLKGKTQAPNEWALAIGQASNGYEVTNAVEGVPGQNQSTTPVSQLTTPFIGDGHSHKGARGNPSGGDLYDMIKATLNHPGLTYRFVYGHSGGVPEVYALVINDKALAQYFLTQYPENENCNNTNNDHSIKIGSTIGKEFYKAEKHYSEGRVENTSGENYEQRTVAMAYILEKFNVGISIAKVDANGNLKKINASVEKITISNSGGAVKEGIKVSKCP